MIKRYDNGIISELVAGLITEYSTIYFSLILLSEYCNLIALSYILILIISSYPFLLVFILCIVCLIRSTLNRLKYDELMTTARLIIIPITSSILISVIVIILSLLILFTFSCVIGMSIHRNSLIKSFLCYESFFFTVFILVIIWSCSINGILIIIYLLWNSTSEIILGISILFSYLFMIIKLSFISLFYLVFIH